MTWYDEFGNRHDEITVDKEAASFASIPKRDRLLDVYCPEGHLFAVVPKAPEGGVPVVYVASESLSPMLVLLENGFAGALVDYDTEPPTVLALGGPLASYRVVCPACVEDYELIFGALSEHLARPGRKKEMCVGASVTSEARRSPLE